MKFDAKNTKDYFLECQIKNTNAIRSNSRKSYPFGYPPHVEARVNRFERKWEEIMKTVTEILEKDDFELAIKQQDLALFDAEHQFACKGIV